MSVRDDQITLCSASPDSLGSLLSRGLCAGWNCYYRSTFFQFSLIGRALGQGNAGPVYRFGCQRGEAVLMSHLPPPRVEGPLVRCRTRRTFAKRVSDAFHCYGYTDVCITQPRGKMQNLHWIDNTNYLMPAMTSEAAQVYKPVEWTWQGILHDERGDPSCWKVEEGDLHGRNRGCVGPAAPCGIQPTSSCKTARSHREDVSGLTLDLRHRLLSTLSLDKRHARL